jgi:hypothetical protein
MAGIDRRSKVLTFASLLEIEKVNITLRPQDVSVIGSPKNRFSDLVLQAGSIFRINPDQIALNLQSSLDGKVWR